MLQPDEIDILRRIYQQVPQFGVMLENRLSKELHDLPSVNMDKVQLYQGRCLALRELLTDLEAAGTMAHRTTKPNFSTP